MLLSSALAGQPQRACRSVFSSMQNTAAGRGGMPTSPGRTAPRAPKTQRLRRRIGYGTPRSVSNALHALSTRLANAAAGRSVPRDARGQLRDKPVSETTSADLPQGLAPCGTRSLRQPAACGKRIGAVMKSAVAVDPRNDTPTTACCPCRACGTYNSCGARATGPRRSRLGWRAPVVSRPAWVSAA